MPLSRALKESEDLINELFMRLAAVRRNPNDESLASVRGTAARLHWVVELLSRHLAVNKESTDAPLVRERVAALCEYLKMLKPADERDLFHHFEVEKPIRITSKPMADLTDEARRANVSGRVRVRAVLAADGSVKHILPAITLGYGLTEKTIDAARLVRFEPAVRGGRAVSQVVLLEYSFDP